MFTFKTISAAAVGLALVLAAQSASAETAWTQQGSSSGPYLFKTYNQTSQDIWVTYYNAATGNHEGEACIPPGQNAGIASNDWASYGAFVQIEVKKSASCGSGNYADLKNVGKSGLGNGWMIAKGGTSHIVVSGDKSNPTVSFTQ